MDTPEAAGWVLVLVADGAGCTRRVGEVRGGLGDVRETGFPPSDSQSSETRGWGGAWHSLETEPRTRRGRTRSTGCCLLLQEETTRCFHLLRKSRVSLVYNVCCNPGGPGVGNMLFVCGQDGYKQHFSQQHPKSLFYSVTGVCGGPFWGGGTTQREMMGTGEEIKTNEFQHLSPRSCIFSAFFALGAGRGFGDRVGGVRCTDARR